LELYGCPFSGSSKKRRRKSLSIDYLDGVVSYSIPQGDKRAIDTEFYDETYDGRNENGILKG